MVITIARWSSLRATHLSNARLRLYVSVANVIAFALARVILECRGMCLISLI